MAGRRVPQHPTPEPRRGGTLTRAAGTCVVSLGAVFSIDDARSWIDLLDGRGVAFWVDGGWGVDALLGEQTRPHEDLDLVVEAHHELVVVDLLRGRGYAEVETPFSTWFHSVWRDGESRMIDLHVITINDQGDGKFGPGDVYPAAGLQGQGFIGGRIVRCITAEVQLGFHLGYDHDDGDRADVLALCERFDLSVPPQYRD